jgi:hypothetical protein
VPAFLDGQILLHIRFPDLKIPSHSAMSYPRAFIANRRKDADSQVVEVPFAANTRRTESGDLYLTTHFLGGCYALVPLHRLLFRRRLFG